MIAEFDKKWEYEIGFYLTCEKERIGKFLNQLEIYKQILNVPGDIMEFGVYKGSSFMRLLAFRDLLEKGANRKLVGFDAFGRFPKNLQLESDLEFVQRFENEGGDGMTKSELEGHLVNKKASNFELIEGDIMQTLPMYIDDNPELKLSLIHIDVDVYEPSKLILELLWENLESGGVLMLDDYGTVAGETKAVDEFFNGKAQVNNLPYYHVPAYIVKS